MRETQLLSLVLVSSFLLTTAVSSLSLRDPNTCAIQETFTTTRNVTVSQPISVRSYEWCFEVPPRCTIQRTEWRRVVETQVIPMTRTAIGCCRGYKLNGEDTCAPACTDGCSGGSCIAPETCIKRQLPTSSLIVTPTLSTEKIVPVETSTIGTSTIESDHDLQIEDSLLTGHLNGIIEENGESVNFTIVPTSAVVPKSDQSTESTEQGYKVTTITTGSYKVTLSNALSYPLISPTTEVSKSVEEYKGLKVDMEINKHDSLNSTEAMGIVDNYLEPVEHSTHETDVSAPYKSKELSTEKEPDITPSILKANVSEVEPKHFVPGDSTNILITNNTVVWRDPLKYRNQPENKRQDNDTTYSKQEQMNLSERFVYSIGISIGIMFAIIMVTLVITKHQQYLHEIDPRCGNVRNSDKCKAAHKTDEPETTLHVVHYQLTREIPITPTIECETTCINSTRNSTITVYNFSPPSNTIDLPVCPTRPFGDYDFPSPLAENVYDEIPAHRDARDGFRCFVRE